VGEAATVAVRTQPEAGHHYVIGCDWGRSNDYTVFVVLDVTAKSIVALDRSNRVDYSLQCERLKALSERWQPHQIIAEQNSIGQPVIEQLTRDGLRIHPFTTTNTSKAKAIEPLALAFERGEIHILNDPVLVSELVAYQAQRLPSGQLRYSAPDGQHDDTVMALAMAWSAVSGQHHLIYPIPDRKSPFRTIGGVHTGWLSDGTRWRPSGARSILSRMCCICTARIVRKLTPPSMRRLCVPFFISKLLSSRELLNYGWRKLSRAGQSYPTGIGHHI
jgi:hypothetical protein